MRFLLTVAAFLLASCFPAGSQEAPQWEVRRDLVIGSYDRPDYDLVVVHDLTVDEDGRIYVLQRQLGTVRVFDSEGRFVRAIGRSGSGPGELGMAGTVGFRRDTLWISDRINNRLSLFDSEGNHLAELFGLRSGPGAHYTWKGPSALLTDGTLLNVPGLSGVALAEGSVTTLPYVRSSSETVLDTVLTQSMTRQVMRVADPLAGPGRGRFITQPWTDHDLSAYSSDGDEFVHVQRRVESAPVLTIVKIRPNGDTTFIRDLEVTPVPLPDTVVDEWVKERLDRSEEAGVLTRTLEGAIREVLYTPEFVPAVEEVVLGRDGTVWLRRTSVNDDAEQATWIILDEEGNRLADVGLPPSFRLLEVRLPYLYGVHTDQMDVPFVERYEVLE